jgi:hypothetical protein
MAQGIFENKTIDNGKRGITKFGKPTEQKPEVKEQTEVKRMSRKGGTRVRLTAEQSYNRASEAMLKTVRGLFGKMPTSEMKKLLDLAPKWEALAEETKNALFPKE